MIRHASQNHTYWDFWEMPVYHLKAEVWFRIVQNDGSVFVFVFLFFLFCFFVLFLFFLLFFFEEKSCFSQVEQVLPKKTNIGGRFIVECIYCNIMWSSMRNMQSLLLSFSIYYRQPFKRQPHKMVKHTQFVVVADELFGCVWPFCGVGA